jgi:hypothetical protein
LSVTVILQTRCILWSLLFSVNDRSGSFSTGTNPAASVAWIERSEIREQPHRTTPHFASLNAGYALLTLSQIRTNEAREKAAKAAQTSASAA